MEDPNDISIKYNELKGLTNCDENNAKTCTGHLQAAPVLQQASLPNKLANTYGVKSLSHVPGTWAKRGKLGSTKRFKQATQQLQ